MSPCSGAIDTDHVTAPVSGSHVQSPLIPCSIGRWDNLGNTPIRDGPFGQSQGSQLTLPTSSTYPTKVTESIRVWAMIIGRVRPHR